MKKRHHSNDEIFLDVLDIYRTQNSENKPLPHVLKSPILNINPSVS